MHRVALTALALAVAATLAACGGHAPAKSGGSGAPVELRAVAPNHVADQTLGNLRGRHGTVTVADVTETVSYASGAEDAAALAAVRRGDAEIAIVRAGTLADAGAGALRALQVPLVVTSDAQAERIADDPVADDLLASVGSLDLVGLALVPGGLRHPFGYREHVLRGPADYAGGVINTRGERDVARIFAALGATTDSTANAERTRRVLDGRLRGIEVSFHQAEAVDLPATVTSNVILYDKFDVVVIRREAWDALNGAQRDALRDAVHEAARTTLAARPAEEQGLLAFCRRHASNRAVQATPSDLAAFEAALAPVVADATADPAVGAAVARMRALAAEVPAPAPLPDACPPPTPSAAAFPAVEPEGDQRVLDGVWRVDARAETMAAAGAPSSFQQANEGIWTWTFRNGIARGEQPRGGPCLAAYAIAGDRVTFDYADLPESECGEALTGTFRRTGDRLELAFTSARDEPAHVAWEQAIWAGGLQRVGDAPAAGQDALDGAWRLTTTAESLERVEPGESRKDVGVWTLHLAGGAGTADQPSGPSCELVYAIDGDRFAFSMDFRPDNNCGGTAHGRFRLDGDALTIDFNGPNAAFFDAFFGGGLTRVGG